MGWLRCCAISLHYCDMDREAQAHNQLQLNLEVPYDIRRLEARLKPPQPVVIEKLSALQLPQSHHISADTAAHTIAAAELASVGMLSRDRLAAAQVLARRDLKQRKYLADAQQRLAGAVTASSSVTRRVPSVSPLPILGASSPRAPATRIVSSMALAGRRTPDRPGSSGSGSGAKSATAATAARSAKSESKKRPSSTKASVVRPSIGRVTADAPPQGNGEATATEAAAAAEGGARVSSVQLSALQEHIRTIESELRLLGSLAGKSSRKDEALRRLSESHRGAIQALQSFASNLPSRKRIEGDATYEQLSSMMTQLSQLCTQLELSGAAAPSKDPRDAAKEEIVAAGGIARQAAVAALPAASATIVLRLSKKTTSSGGRRVKSSPTKMPSDRLYPRGKSTAPPTKKAMSAGTAAARRSPYAPRQSPTIVSPYLTKPLAVTVGSAVTAHEGAVGISGAGQHESKRASAVHFNVAEPSLPDEPHATDVEHHDLLNEEGLPVSANFLERLLDARKGYTDRSPFARGAYSHDGDTDVIDPKWLEETTNAVYLQQQEQQQQRQQRQQQEAASTAAAAAVRTSFAASRAATGKLSADRLSAAASTGSLRGAQQQQWRQQQLQPPLLLQQQRSAENVGAAWELKDRDGASSRKPSTDSLNGGLTRMLEAKVSSNGDLLADMILSELVEDTAREMAELEEEGRVGDGSVPTPSQAELYDQLLARIDAMQAEQDNMRRRWTDVSLYVRSVSPDLPSGTGTAGDAAATGEVLPADFGHGDSSSMSSSAAAGAAQAREHGGEEGRALTFTRRSRPTAAQACSLQQQQQQLEAEAARESSGSEVRRRPASTGATAAIELSVPRSLLLSIAESLDEYRQFLERTHQVTTSEFDPAQFVEECAAALQEDCIEAVAGELGQAASDIVDTLYKDEFVTEPGADGRSDRSER